MGASQATKVAPESLSPLESLPKDILFEVLRRATIPSLGRIRCCSRTTNRISSENQFQSRLLADYLERHRNAKEFVERAAALQRTGFQWTAHQFKSAVLFTRGFYFGKYDIAKVNKKYIRVVFCGPPQSGKTSLIMSLLGRKFDSYLSSTSDDSLHQRIIYSYLAPTFSAQLQLWEHHPHGSRFRILDVQGLPIRIATVLFLVCDLTEPSVRQLEIHESQTEGAKCPRVIVATKVDNASDLQTEDSQLMIRLLQKVADRNQLPILFVSAKTNVQSLLDYIQDLVRSNCNEEAVQEWHATWG